MAHWYSRGRFRKASCRGLRDTFGNGDSRHHRASSNKTSPSTIRRPNLRYLQPTTSSSYGPRTSRTIKANRNKPQALSLRTTTINNQQNGSRIPFLSCPLKTPRRRHHSHSRLLGQDQDPTTRLRLPQTPLRKLGRELNHLPSHPPPLKLRPP